MRSDAGEQLCEYNRQSRTADKSPLMQVNAPGGFILSRRGYTDMQYLPPDAEKVTDAEASRGETQPRMGGRSYCF